MWQDAELLELFELNQYSYFGDCGEYSQPLSGYKIIIVHMAYNVKYNSYHKDCLVIGQHLTNLSIKCIFRSCFFEKFKECFLEELNSLSL